MPIYEYHCEACDKTFDHLARTMTDTGPIACPVCESKKTRRLLSVFAVGPENAPPPAPGGCGRCGGPGPCGMD